MRTRARRDPPLAHGAGTPRSWPLPPRRGRPHGREPRRVRLRGGGRARRHPRRTRGSSSRGPLPRRPAPGLARIRTRRLAPTTSAAGRARPGRPCRSSSASRAAGRVRSRRSRGQALDDRAGDPPRLADAERHEHVSRARPCERDLRGVVEGSEPSRGGSAPARGRGRAFRSRRGAGRRGRRSRRSRSPRLRARVPRRAPGTAAACARTRAAGTRRSEPAGRARAPWRAPLRSRLGCVRSRRAPARLRRSPTSSNLRPTPVNPARARSASSRTTPASSSAASAVAALRRLCSPGIASVDVRRLELPAAHRRRRPRHPLVEVRGELGFGRVRGVVIELDVRHDGDLRLEEADRAVRLVALDDEPALPDARVAAELRDYPADDPGRIPAELAQDVRDHRGRRGLAVRASDDDRAASRDELGEERCARPSLRRGPHGRSRRSPRIPPAARARRRRPPRSRRGPRGRSSRATSQPRTSAPHARAKFAYAESPAPPIPTK